MFLLKIAIGCDSAGFFLKGKVADHLKNKGYEVLDCGTDSTASCHYPVFAEKVAKKVQGKECDFGVLICGTGIGMSIAANKVSGIRAACVSEHYSAKYTRLHNDSNIICLGARVIGDELALELCDIFLETEFEGGRHAERVEMIRKIEEK